MKKYFLLLSLLPLLNGCMSDEEWRAMKASEKAAGEREICKKGSLTLGRDYALAGVASAPGLVQYRELCEKHDFVVDQKQWNSGHKSGVAQYCTPLQAYKTGKQNYTYETTLCHAKGTRISQLNAAWTMGLHWKDLNYQIKELAKEYDNLESTIRDLDERKDRMKDKEDAREARYLLRRLKQEQRDSERTLRQYRSQLSALDSQNLSAIVKYN